MTTMKVVKLSICPCGFPLWGDVVRLGDLYKTHEGSVQKALLECGGCLSKTSIHAVLAVNERDKGWIVLEALEEVVQ